MNITEWLERAKSELRAIGISTARLDAEIILAHTLRKPRTWLQAHATEQLDGRQLDVANARFDLRLDRVPVAYIIGHKEFYGRTFKVSTATLIPRPESESLIELLASALPPEPLITRQPPLRLVDVGTGSGNLGITAKLQYPELDVTLIDNSRHALTIAEDNATNLQATVGYLKSNLLEAYPFSADIIMANLPYVDARWPRSPETNHEPPEALFASDGGLALIYELINQTKEKLVLGGKLLLEADPVQHAAIISSAHQQNLVLSKQQDYGLLFDKLA